MHSPPSIRVASVSYLNAKPLIWGLDNDPDIGLLLRVPSGLVGLLADHSADVALLPVVDTVAVEGASLLPVGGIACDGPTLTVRIFSDRPIERITTLACDIDSHTSVQLARIILRERYGISPELVPWKLGEPVSGPRLMIGDKVVSDEPTGMPHQIDLGEQWKLLTGLPFVFAVWTTRSGVDRNRIGTRLRRSLEEGLANIDRIVEREAYPRGWPATVARRYMTEYLRYRIGSRELDAISLFLAKVREMGAPGGES